MTPSRKTSRKSDATAEKTSQARPAAQDVAPDQVPEWAEDIEHTLRRINAEKQSRRDKDPGLYR